MAGTGPDRAGWRSRAHEIIFEAETPAGKAFDIAPQTILGWFLASAVMITGYGIIAVPTGIVTVEIASVLKSSTTTEACPECGTEAHAADARFCRRCGAKL